MAFDPNIVAKETSLLQTFDKRNQAEEDNDSYDADDNTDNHVAPNHCEAHTYS